MDGWIDRQMVAGLTRLGRRIDLDEWTDGWIGWVGLMDEWDGWMDGWRAGLNGWMDG